MYAELFEFNDIQHTYHANHYDSSTSMMSLELFGSQFVGKFTTTVN